MQKKVKITRYYILSITTCSIAVNIESYP